MRKNHGMLTKSDFGEIRERFWRKEPCVVLETNPDGVLERKDAGLDPHGIGRVIFMPCWYTWV